MGFLENTILVKSHFVTGALHTYNLISLSDETTCHTELSLLNFYLYGMSVLLHFYRFYSITPIVKKVITTMKRISPFIHAFSFPSHKYEANRLICYMKLETSVIKQLLPLTTVS